MLILPLVVGAHAFGERINSSAERPGGHRNNSKWHKYRIFIQQLEARPTLNLPLPLLPKKIPNQEFHLSSTHCIISRFIFPPMFPCKLVTQLHRRLRDIQSISIIPKTRQQQYIIAPATARNQGSLPPPLALFLLHENRFPQEISPVLQYVLESGVRRALVPRQEVPGVPEFGPA